MDRELRDEAMLATKAVEQPIGAEVMMAIEKQLAEQEDLLGRLRGRLSPVLNYRTDRADTANKEKGLYSPLVNGLMSLSDAISINNRTIREMMEALEV